MNYIEDSKIILNLDKSIYSKDSIIKCIYWYTDKYLVEVEDVENKFFHILLTPINSEDMGQSNLKHTLAKVQKDFIDFNLRDIVTKETQNIRDLLIAKAFSNYSAEEGAPL